MVVLAAAENCENLVGNSVNAMLHAYSIFWGDFLPVQFFIFYFRIVFGANQSKINCKKRENIEPHPTQFNFFWFVFTRRNSKIFHTGSAKPRAQQVLCIIVCVSSTVVYRSQESRAQIKNTVQYHFKLNKRGNSFVSGISLYWNGVSNYSQESHISINLFLQL